VNAIDDATTIADNPATAASTCTIDAVCTPSTDTMPARIPWAPLRATMNSTAGPGISRSASDATMKTGSVESDGTSRQYAAAPTISVVNMAAGYAAAREPRVAAATTVPPVQLAASSVISAIASSRHVMNSSREWTAAATLVTPRCTVLS